MTTTKRRRAPRGYRIQRWQDGTYHAYAPGGDCINETRTRAGALQACIDHKADQTAKARQAHKTNEAPEPLNTIRLIAISEVTMNALSPEALRLAREYREIVRQQESGDFDNGLTPTELDAKRVRVHNVWLRELQKCGIDTSNRQATRDLAATIENWMRD